MDFHSHSKVDDDTYDVDAWTSFDDDDEDYNPEENDSDQENF